jgi:hypothetical protein
MRACSVQDPEDIRPSSVDLNAHYDMILDAPLTRYDVDSVLTFPSSLGVARQGIKSMPFPSMTSNVRVGLHVQSIQGTYDEDGERQSSLLEVQQVSHICLGRLVGLEDLALYVLFPNLSYDGEKFIALSEPNLTRWTDISVGLWGTSSGRSE